MCVREREREREREKHINLKRGQFRSLAVNRVLRLSVARLQHTCTIVETATEQIQASTAIFVSYVLSD